IMQWFCWHVAAKMSLGFLCLFLVFNTGKDVGLVLPRQQLSLFPHFSASCIRRENKKEKQVAVLATAELPAKSLDLAAINLTELVNGMLSSALRGTKKLFSLLSVTSYSSFAFHKVSVTIYNISNAKHVDPGKFPMRYCYCLNNVTNDLTDFTALLVDIIGNSTSYLTEIFKSTSILSVRQSNDSDCIYICVMTGQTGKNLSDFWEILEKSPAINYTFSTNTSSDLGKCILGNKRKQQQHFMKLQEDPNKTLDPSAEHVWTLKMCWCPPTASLASPGTRIPLAQKGEEIPTMRFPPWPKTAGTKGLWFPSPHMEASRSQGTAGPSPTAGESWAPLPALEPSPSDFGVICFFHCFSCYCYCSNPRPRSYVLLVAFANIGEVFCSFQSHSGCLNYEHVGLLTFFPPALSPFFFPSPPLLEKKVFKNILLNSASSCFFSPGCPQAILRESRVTSPPVTLIVQKINPCVMELCRFFQLCLCVGQRRYSRKEAMRYCVEYYSWFVKNASYVCERVKRVTYSHSKYIFYLCLYNIPYCV
ncbi:HHLA1 protein, partial [Sapayoa aenigma]|nr:HHLA1 protein [Sapayoa aenigma]